MGYEYLRVLFEPDQEGGEPKRLGYDDLVAAIEDHKELRLVNIRDGGYVSKEKYNRLSADVTKYKTELASTTERLNQGISKADGTDDIAALKSAHKAEIAALRAEVKAVNRGRAIDRYLMNEKFSSGLARDICAKMFEEDSNISLVKGELIGIEEALESLKKEDPSAFISEESARALATAPASTLPYFISTGSTKEIPQPAPYRFK